MRKASARRLAQASLTSLGLLGTSALITVSSSPIAVAALPPATTFAFTGAPQSYVVPADVCSVKVDALGAGGGEGAFGGEVGAPAQAGRGGQATSTITVTPGEALHVYVGGRGVNGDWVEEGASSVPGGWNGGGDSGLGAAVGGSGGGASDVRRGAGGLADRVVVAGGGGGSGGATIQVPELFSVGGNGGNPASAGGDAPPKGEEVTPAAGGGAGSASAGGAGGHGDVYGIEDPNMTGTDGALGLGGTGGGEGDNAHNFGSGGGGGGGLYGGGGGGAGDRSEAAGGGGGSSLGDVTVADVNEGDGQVTITPVANCEAPTTTTTTTTTIAPPAASAATAVPARPTYTG